MMKTNYHTHCYLCGHATGEIEDYVKEAIKKGYKIIGISDHGPLSNPPFHRMNLVEFEEKYLKVIDELQIKYKNQIKILKGLEMEYVEDDIELLKYLRSKLDYMIFGCHYYVSKDLNGEVSSYRVDNHEKLESYVRTVEKGLETNLFRILAHPDIFMVSYNQQDEFSLKMCQRIIDACKKNNVLIEINANGLRSPKYEKYPNREFFELVKKNNMPVVIGSDCHKPELLEDEMVSYVRGLAKEIGLEIIDEI